MVEALIGVGGALIAAVIAAWAALRARRPRRADVEAVDARSLELARRHDEDAMALAAELQRARDQAAREKAVRARAASQPAPHAPAARAVSSSGEGPRVEPIDISVPDHQAR